MQPPPTRQQSAEEAAFEPVARAMMVRMATMSCEMEAAVLASGDDEAARDAALDAIAARYAPLVETFIADLGRFTERHVATLPAEEASAMRAHMARNMPQMAAMIPMTRDSIERGQPMHRPGDCGPA
jgi:hypothetical protein